MTDEIKLPRLNVDLPQDLHDALREKLPGRTKSDAVRALLYTLLDDMEVQGGSILFELLNRNVSLKITEKIDS